MKYKFMNPTKLIDKENINELMKKYLIQEYRGKVKQLKLSEKLLEDYLQRIINVKKAEFDTTVIREKLQLEKAPFREQKLLNWCIDELGQIIGNGESYYADLISAIFMGILYVDPSNDIFKFSIDKADIEKTKRKEIESVKEEIRSVWRSKSNDNKINKEVARGNYPIPVIEKEYTENEPEIVSLPGGCWDYHKVMISKENIGIFDNMTKSNSFSKYSFPKAYSIYEKLKNTSIENLLLMEYSIGMGYVNKVYPHISKINSYKHLQEILKFVKEGAIIVPFYIRGEIIDVLWKYLDDENMMNEQKMQNACVLMNYASSVVNAVFEQVLEVWWYYYYLRQKVFFTYERMLVLETSWNNYFNNEVAYVEWITYCGIHDWRNINTVDDCFRKTVSTRNMVDIWLEKNRLDILDIDGMVYSLFVDIPVNDIGNQILEQCKVKLSEKILLPEKRDLYQEFVTLKEEIYNQMRWKEEEEFYKRDIKVSSITKTVKVSHVYAILTKTVIECLLSTK